VLFEPIVLRSIIESCAESSDLFKSFDKNSIEKVQASAKSYPGVSTTGRISRTLQVVLGGSLAAVDPNALRFGHNRLIDTNTQFPSPEFTVAGISVLNT
jgi:hypothetical protein